MIGNKDTIPKAEIDFLARDHGFVVVSVDYSLCPQVSLREGPMKDAEDAYRWCREVFPGLLGGEEDGVEVDGTRMGVLGFSAGGMLATWTVRSSIYLYILMIITDIILINWLRTLTVGFPLQPPFRDCRLLRQ